MRSFSVLHQFSILHDCPTPNQAAVKHDHEALWECDADFEASFVIFVSNLCFKSVEQLYCYLFVLLLDYCLLKLTHSSFTINWNLRSHCLPLIQIIFLIFLDATALKQPLNHLTSAEEYSKCSLESLRLMHANAEFRWLKMYFRQD